jgi:hypothetical protein
MKRKRDKEGGRRDRRGSGKEKSKAEAGWKSVPPNWQLFVAGIRTE